MVVCEVQVDSASPTYPLHTIIGALKVPFFVSKFHMKMTVNLQYSCVEEVTSEHILESVTQREVISKAVQHRLHLSNVLISTLL